MRDFMTVTKALADENRVRVLMALQEGELCACQIQEVLQLAPSTVSKHLAILYQARLVEFRKEGRWVYYRLAASTPARPFVEETLAWLLRHLSDDPKIRADHEHLHKIRAVPRETWCRPATSTLQTG